MFICNFKVNKKLIYKLLFSILFLLAIIIAFFAIYKVFNYEGIDDSIPVPDISVIDSKNYTNVLKSVHDNLDSYVGQQISFVGYVYRVYDFSDSQFVLARDMLIDSNKQTLVVGFLCNYKNASSFTDGTWVNITGKITKGNYHGDIPIIEITNMESCDKPTDLYVSPPDDTYIPTSALF